MSRCKGLLDYPTLDVPGQCLDYSVFTRAVLLLRSLRLSCRTAQKARKQGASYAAHRELFAARTSARGKRNASRIETSNRDIDHSFGWRRVPSQRVTPAVFSILRFRRTIRMEHPGGGTPNALDVFRAFLNASRYSIPDFVKGRCAASLHFTSPIANFATTKKVRKRKCHVDFCSEATGLSNT